MISVIIAGVGGQGAVLLSNILGLACAKNGVPAKTAELHGLSQRSGSIITHLRIGERVISPRIPVGSADVIASMELMEALRNIEYLVPGGLVVSSDRIMHPPSETIAVSQKTREYVQTEEIAAALEKIAGRVILYPGKELAERSGVSKTENVVLLGALLATGLLPLAEEDVLSALGEIIPERAKAANLRAFELGKDAAHAA